MAGKLNFRLFKPVKKTNSDSDQIFTVTKFNHNRFNRLNYSSRYGLLIFAHNKIQNEI